MQSETISVVVPAYNSSSTIVEALNSIIEQTFSVCEIVVVDDLSTDNTVDVVRAWSSDHDEIKLVLIEQSKNSGPAGARNSGIKAAVGGWIAFLDADDAWLPSKLSIQMEAISDGYDVAFVCGRTVPLGGEGKGGVEGGELGVGSGEGEGEGEGDLRSEVGGRHVAPEACEGGRSEVGAGEGGKSNIEHSASNVQYRIKSGIDRKRRELALNSETVRDLVFVDFVAHNPVATSTVMVKREVLVDLGGFDEQFCGPEDYDLWLRLVDKNRCIQLDVPLSRYRHTVGSLSMDERKFLPQVLRVLKKAFSEGGALYYHQEYRRRAHAEQYSSASWMAYNRGANLIALKLLLISWRYDVRKLHKEHKDPKLRLKLLVRYLFSRYSMK